MSTEKICFVPSCPNTDQNNPDKLFAPVIDSLKELWCRKLKVEFNTYTGYYCCEDHLNPDDLENYQLCKLMNDKPKLKPTAELRFDARCGSDFNADPLTSTDVPPDTSNNEEASELFKLLLSEDTKPKRAHKFDYSATWPYKVSVGVQCKAKTRDASVSFIGRKNLPIGFKQQTSSIATHTEVELSDVKNPCCCCLLRAPNSDVRTPYTHDDRTETCMDLFEECFGIELTLDNDDECGICEVCAGRLRDACDFRLQVRRSQERLRAGLGRASVKYEFLADDSDTSGNLMDQNESVPTEPVVKLEVFDRTSEDETDEKDFPTYSEVPVQDCKEEPFSSFTEEQPSISREQRDELTPHQCRICHKTFKRKVGLINHMRSHDKHETQVKKHDSSDENLDVNEKHACDECGMQFKSKPSYTKHIQTHETLKHFTCDICSKIFSREGYLTLHKKSHTREPYTCDYCKKKFIKKRLLAMHIAVHMYDKPYSCGICNKKFKSKYSLKGHRLLHIENKSYSCKICKKQFAHAMLLERHKSVHKKGAFVCETCGRRCLSLSLYTVHKRTHTGEKPFACSMCKKQFASKGNMILHERTHTGVKPYSCKFCPKTFSCPAGLKHHTTVHTREKSFSCDICNKSFSQYSSMKLHKLIHTGEKPHGCQVCGKTFARKAHLKRHLDTHMERKSYACEYCPKVYTHKHGFAQHVRSHTKKS